nr:uncharacterized protein LOC124815532 [Hydra vulgaris]
MMSNFLSLHVMLDEITEFLRKECRNLVNNDKISDEMWDTIENKCKNIQKHHLNLNDFNQLDFTLLCLILFNVNSKISKTTLENIKKVRNKIVHSPSILINDEEFQVLSSDLILLMGELNINKTQTLKLKNRKYQIEIKEEPVYNTTIQMPPEKNADATKENQQCILL